MNTSSCWSSGSATPDTSSTASSSSLSAQSPDGCVAECRLFSEKPDRQEKRLLDETEKLIAKDLYAMSSQERQDVLHDIHGVNELTEEYPEVVAQKMNELELDLIHNLHRSEAFQMVWMQAPDYVRGLYMTFLRCDAYDIPTVSNRVRLHFDTKLWLFGKEKLCRDITLNDFDKHDMACYKAGFFQILPHRDRAGRPICIKLWKLQTFHCRENVWRQLWYNHMTMLKDKDTQLKGMVQIIYNINDNWKENFDRDLYLGVAKIRAATPIRVIACHYCFSDPAFGVIIKLVTTAMEMHTRTRTRLHLGSDIEVQYELQGFGIPLKPLPVNSEGKFRVKEHLAWIKTRKFQEQSSKYDETNTVIVPTHMDVLFGRGKALQNHIGNLRFSNILEDKMERYFSAKRIVKLDIAKEVLHSIQKTGGRFLRQNKEGIWEEVDESVAIDKIGHGFRNRKPDTTSVKASSEGRSLVDKRRAASPSSTSESSSSCDSKRQETAPQRILVSQQYIAKKRSKFDTIAEEKLDNSAIDTATISFLSSVSTPVDAEPILDFPKVEMPDILDELSLDLETADDLVDHPLDEFATDLL